VTSNLSINFLLRPDPVDVVAEAKLIRVGRRLAYAEVALYSVGRDDIIAHATGSYALGSGKK
jgi:acyl-coenzyme A thioesterase PaaI-like protein